MSRFIAILNASNPDLLTSIENAGGQVVSVSEPGVVVIDGDQSVADAVSQIQAVQAVSPVDASWDTSELSLGGDVAVLVNAWNTSLGADYQAALSDPYRAGEPWDFPNGCDPDNPGAGGDGGPLVADSGDGTGTGTGTGDTTGTGNTTGSTDTTGAVASTDTGTGDTSGTGSGDTTGTGDATSGQVASNDPQPTDGGDGTFGGFDDGQGGGQPA
ncbi:hypothetical protein [Cellulomonas alba]|uniref:BRCT domain-containing protein n=1 Tax=Cellulomonas alba TaxID=3053467 RepID=A0ABT7SBF5_9CELL|nr:hypothetical protein [Cellulomonas alba]MDM7853471.1 hypothetical protein [Cellulomonas alba]